MKAAAWAARLIVAATPDVTPCAGSQPPSAIQETGQAIVLSLSFLHVRALDPPRIIGMSFLYVATSKNLSSWASDVGLTKFVFKLGVAADKAEDAVADLNQQSFAGESDWKLLKKQAANATLDEDQVVDRVAARERMIDPAIYPKIKGARGIFKVKIANVANHLLISRALAGEDEKVDKVKPSDIAGYLFKNALD